MKEKFAETVFSKVKDAFAGRGEVSLIPVLKNNGIRLTGISLKGPGKDTAPVVYLDFYYQMFRYGFMTLDAVLADICGLLGEYRDCGPSPDDLADYGRIRERLVCRLVNRERNRERLEEIPHIPYLDMEIVFVVLVSGSGPEEAGMMTFMVNNEISRKWPGDARDLFSQAVENMQRLCPATLESIRETVKRFAGNSLYGDVSGKLEDRLCSGRVPPMYILSSRTGIYGAAAILYPGVLKRFAESQGSDLVIIPSSIHEVLLIPLEKETDTGQLRSMVREINETELLPEDRLSDQVYIYRREKDRVEIAD